MMLILLSHTHGTCLLSHVSEEDVQEFVQVFFLILCQNEILSESSYVKKWHGFGWSHHKLDGNRERKTRLLYSRMIK